MLWVKWHHLRVFWCVLRATSFGPTNLLHLKLLTCTEYIFGLQPCMEAQFNYHHWVLFFFLFLFLNICCHFLKFRVLVSRSEHLYRNTLSSSVYIHKVRHCFYKETWWYLMEFRDLKVKFQLRWSQKLPFHPFTKRGRCSWNIKFSLLSLWAYM